MTWETPEGIWVAAADGSGARAVQGVPPRYYSVARSPADIGSHRPIDRYFDVSIIGEIVFAPITEGRRELWTARLR